MDKLRLEINEKPGSILRFLSKKQKIFEKENCQVFSNSGQVVFEMIVLSSEHYGSCEMSSFILQYPSCVTKTF